MKAKKELEKSVNLNLDIAEDWQEKRQTHKYFSLRRTWFEKSTITEISKQKLRKNSWESSNRKNEKCQQEL